MANGEFEFLSRRIKQRRAQEEAGAQSEAVRRGLAGTSFESGMRGRAAAEEGQALSDLDLQLQLADEEKEREERLIAEKREFQTGLEETRTRRDRQSDVLGAGLELGGTALADYLFNKRGGRGTLPVKTGDGGAVPEVARSGGDLATPGPGISFASRVRSFFGGGPKTKPTAGVTPKPGATQGFGSIAGRVLGAGAAGYAGSRLGKLAGLTGGEASKATSRGAKAGTVIGAGLGALIPGAGILGAGIGGAVGGKAGATVARAFKKVCFMGNTIIELIDGSVSRIDQLKLGMRVKGGTIYSLRQSYTESGTLYEYNDVFVTGSHAVKEDGKWVRVVDSKGASPVVGGEVVWSLGTTGHRIFTANGIEFADEFEHDDSESLTDEQSLFRLNEQEKMEVANV
jgi:hypothetical protein